MTMQPGLFDAAPYRVESRNKPKPRELPPVSGIQWRRTGLKRDCATCWRQQAAEYDPAKPLHTVRQPAVAELKMWDDEGCLSHHEFYCKKHAEALGWDGSRSYDYRKRRNVEAEAKTALAFKLNCLVGNARFGVRGSFDADVCDLVRKAGAANLEMPEWTVTTAGTLSGRFHARVFRAVQEWADCFNTDTETEMVTRFERHISATCRIIDAPAFTLRVHGFAPTPKC